MEWNAISRRQQSRDELTSCDIIWCFAKKGSIQTNSIRSGWTTEKSLKYKNHDSIDDHPFVQTASHRMEYMIIFTEKRGDGNTYYVTDHTVQVILEINSCTQTKFQEKRKPTQHTLDTLESKIECNYIESLDHKSTIKSNNDTNGLNRDHPLDQPLCIQ